MNDKETTLEKLVTYQQELQAEEEWLKKMIDKLNDQAHALQVEQLHILNAMNKKSSADKPDETTSNSQVVAEKEALASQDLDLTVPTYQSCEEDEEDDDDDDETEE